MLPHPVFEINRKNIKNQVNKKYLGNITLNCQLDTIAFAFELDYVSTHARSGKTFQYKVGELNCRLCGINFGLNATLYQAHFNVHRKKTILLFKDDGMENLPGDTKKVVTESTGLVQM